MSERMTRAWVASRLRLRSLATRLVADESGEGVISAAIAVLIMAFLGAAMWLAFKAVFDGAQDNISEQVNTIGG